MKMLIKTTPVYLMALLLLVACASHQVAPQDMAPKDLATWANKAYIASYDAYLDEYTRPAVMTEDRREALRKKKKVLIALHNKLDILNSLLLMYDNPVMDDELVNSIVNLVYELTGVY